MPRATAEKTAVTTAPLRTARRAWNLLHIDSPQSRRLAERAVAAAQRDGDTGAEGWARIALGYHLLYFGTVSDAARELKRAQRCFERGDDRAGHILASAALARSMWREGRVREALAAVLPLRDEGVQVLRHEQRGVLLNTIAGCYSALGDSAQAFAHMFEALRDAGPKRGRGFDTVLHCNLSHELMQIGDYEHALQHVDQGLAGCTQLRNDRLLGILLINRVICLTELGRAAEARPDVAAVLAMPTDASGRGSIEPAFEALAISALRAGDLARGAELVARAQALGDSAIPDERVERVTAAALLALTRGDAKGALRTLRAVRDEAARDDLDGLSLRIRAQYYGVASEAHEAAGQPAEALAALRRWQQLSRAQSQLASRARYQAAALQTELLRLQHRLDENDARRRRTERDRAELATINAQLSRKIEEVQSLQEALRAQAVRDALTGLFNRRHLAETLPTLFAIARRERQPLALAIIDLDHFKRVNDRHGHAVGDRLLQAFGELLASQLRRSDVACRYGGEEFCLLMPRTGADAARRKVQALLRRWRAMRFEIDDDEVLEGQSFSAGVADTLAAAPSPDALLKAADDELLAAKRAGRNRVTVSRGGATAADTLH